MLRCAFCRRVVLALIGSAGILGAGIPGATAVSQQPAVKPARPKVGLVFEGGGALGFAHIGVIEYLEAHHIPVDYVAGTSMGGLVGGLYAAGNSPDEIKQFVGKIDWPGVLSGQIPFQSLSYRRKEDRLAYPNRLELGLKRGLSVPNGLNSGSAVGLLFDRAALPYYDMKSFDDLPIPFRCVATDIVSGQEHVFKDGSLAQALRSTMSIPGVFAPVAHGNQIYSDGGAVNNLPVDVARAMGAEIVIAVYLDTGKPDPSTFNSLVGVAGRNVAIMVAANEAQNMKDANILLKADVSKFGSGDFDKSVEIIPQGEKVAESHATELERYAVNDADWKAYVAERSARRRTTVPVPQFVDVYGLKGASQAEVASKFRQYIGKPIDPDKLEKTITDLQGTWMSSSDSNNIQLGFGGRATFMDIAGPGSELRVDAAVGQQAGAVGELYKPLTTAANFFVAPRLYYVHTLTSLYSGSQQLAQYTENRNGLGADVGYRFNAKAELRAGEDYQWFGEELKIGSPVAPVFSLTPLVSNIRFQYLGQDSVVVPTRGTEFLTRYAYSTQRPNGSGGYSQWKSTVSHFIPVGSRGILFGTVEGGTSFGADNLGLAG